MTYQPDQPNGGATSGTTPTGSPVNTFLGGYTSTQLDDLLGTRAGTLNLPTGPGKNQDVGNEVLSIFSLDPEQVYHLQSMMVDAGMISEQQATGFVQATSTDPTLKAWRTVVETAAQTYNTPNAVASPVDVLRWAAKSGNYATVATELKKRVQTIQDEISSPKPVSVTLTDPNALRDQLAATFTDAVGYGPSTQQIDQFVAQEHGAENQVALGQRDATNRALQQELQRTRSQEHSLIRLGPDGIESFLGAMRQVVAQRTGQQGPSWQVPASQSQPVPTETVGSPGTPSRTEQAMTPGHWTYPVGGSGRAAVREPPVWVPATPQVAGTTPWYDRFVPNSGSPFSESFWYGKARGPHPVMQTVPGTPSTEETVGNPLYFHGRGSVIGTRPTLTQWSGGAYGLNPDAWQWGVQHLGLDLSRYGDPAQAPEAIQHSVALAYAAHEFKATGNWGDVASMMTSGQPLSAMKDKPVFQVQNGRLTMQDFAGTLVSDVNRALMDISNQMNSPINTPVVDKTAPDPAADAAAVARQSDPNGYIATQASQYYGFLNEALTGAPTVQAKDQTSTTGGVGEASGAAVATGASVGA